MIPRSGISAGEGVGYPLQYSWASLVAQLVKNLPAMRETWVGKIPSRRKRLPTPVFGPGESHGLCIVHGVAKSRTRLSHFHSTSASEGKKVKEGARGAGFQISWIEGA